MTNQIEMTKRTGTPSLLAAWNDAGLLREYVIGRYYRTYYWYGISPDNFAGMLRLLRRLAALAGKTTDEVFADLNSDVEA